MNTDALFCFTAASAYLFLKMFLNSGLQGYARFRGLGFKYPEDQAFKKSIAPNEKLADLEFRATAAWRNDLENIPMFVVAALCGLLAGVPLFAYQVLLTAYCGFRTLHTLTLITGKQPWRFIGYAGGISVTGVLFLWSLKLLLPA